MLLILILSRYNGILGQAWTNRKQVEQTFAKRWFMKQCLTNWPHIVVNDPDSTQVSPSTVSLGELFQREHHKIPEALQSHLDSLLSRNTRTVLENHEKADAGSAIYEDLLATINPFVRKSVVGGANEVLVEDPFAIEAEVRLLYEMEEKYCKPGQPKPLSEKGCIVLAQRFDPRSGHLHQHDDANNYKHNTVQLSQCHLLNVELVGKKQTLHLDETGLSTQRFVPKAPDIFCLGKLSKLIKYRLEHPDSEKDVWLHTAANYKVCGIQNKFDYYPAIVIGMEKYESKNYYTGIRSNVLVVNSSRDNRVSMAKDFTGKEVQIHRSFKQSIHNLREKYPDNVSLQVEAEPCFHPAKCWGFVKVSYSAALKDIMEANPNMVVVTEPAKFGVVHNLETIFALCEFHKPHFDRLVWDWAPLAELWTTQMFVVEEKYMDVAPQGFWHLVPISQLRGKFTGQKVADMTQYAGTYGKNLMSVTRWPRRDAI